MGPWARRGPPAEGGTEPGQLAFSLLRRGAVVEAAAVIWAVRPAERHLRLAVTGMETAVALGGGDLEELEHLRKLAEGDDELQARIAACLADHFILRGDPVAATIAAQALVSMPDDPMLAAELLWARGRLRRAIAVCALFIPGDRPAIGLLASGPRRSPTWDGPDSMRNGRSARAEVPFVWTLVSYDDVDRAQAAVTESLARLRAPGLVLRGAGPGVPGLPLRGRGRHGAPPTRARTRWSSCGRIGVPTPWAVPSSGTSGWRAGCSERVRPRMSWPPSTTTCRWCALWPCQRSAGSSSGSPDSWLTWARSIWRGRGPRAVAGELSTPQTASDLVGLVARIDLLERGDDDAVAAVDADLTRTRDLGLEREAALRALRAARAAQRNGRHDVAARLPCRGCGRLAAAGPTHAVGARAGPAADHRRPRHIRFFGCSGRNSRWKSTARSIWCGRRRPGWPSCWSPMEGRPRSIVSSTRCGQMLISRPGEPACGWHSIGFRHVFGEGGADLVLRRGDVVAFAPDVEVDVVRFEQLASGGEGRAPSGPGALSGRCVRRSTRL